MTNDWTVPALERMLEQKKTRLESLARRREGLLRKLTRLDRMISRLGGQKFESGFAVQRKVRRRPRNARPLTPIVMEVLKKQKAGLPLDKLSTAVLNTGYKSGSPKFKNVLYQCLYNNKETIVHDKKTGAYRLR